MALRSWHFDHGTSIMALPAGNRCASVGTGVPRGQLPPPQPPPRHHHARRAARRRGRRRARAAPDGYDHAMAAFAPTPPPPPGADVLRDESLARHTYLRIGGPARYFATPADCEQLAQLSAWADAARLPLRVLGGGSNVLVSDGGVHALVISLRRACGETRFEGPAVTAGAAVMLPALARAAAARGLGGLEFAIGIPGSVGGALQSNAGIGDGRCIGPLVRSVEVLEAGAFRTLDAGTLRFEYRSSSLRGRGLVTLGATLALLPAPRPLIEAEMRRLLDARASTQPTAEPNAGSIFRNPAGNHAGRLIEAAGCKGLTVGAASVSTLHANFIVHDGSATATEVAALMLEVQRRVGERFGVALQPEVEWWGDGPPPPCFGAEAV
ncbi:MAG: UDP-N-acetylmuramate dehydrogenase [Dehalococcoidia bacterium]|nr:UDP-N-acetylmuramate dehydrogenase [Dehalococcoidia bacterium]